MKNPKLPFSNDNPIELEIGMGRPHFIFERALAVPEHNIVGIEYKREWVEKAIARKAREHIANVHAIHAHAWELVPTLLEPESVVNIVVNFPDPWWKKRHHKRRILNPDFVEVLVSKLQTGGTFFLQSDVSGLFDEYLQNLEENPGLKNVYGPKGQCPDNPMHAQSHREKKCVELGIPIYRALLRRV